MSDVEDFKDVLFNKKLHWLLLTYLLAFGGVYWIMYLMPIGLMAFFCRYDSIGYGEILGDKRDGSFPLKNYRMQDGEISAIFLLLGIIILKLLGHTWWDGLVSFLIFFVIYWTGGKDLLFYWAREEYLGDLVYRKEQDIWEENLWSWMYFTPLGIYEIFSQGKNLIKVYTHKDVVYLWIKDLKTQAYVGLAIASLILTFWAFANTAVL